MIKNRYLPSVVDKPWWLAGGIPRSACVAAYQAVGASSYTASKVNLNNPGTNNALNGTAYPNWDAINGWIFDVNNKYLDTTVNPTANYSMIIRFSNASPGHICGCRVAPLNNEFGFLANNNGSQREFRTSNFRYRITGNVTNGVAALCGLPSAQCYFNGNKDLDIANFSLSGGFNIWIGCTNTNGSVGSHSTPNVQAFAIYRIALSSVLVVALTNAMNAL